MGAISLNQERAERASAAVAALPGAYLGASPGTDRTLRLQVGETTWGVRVSQHSCQVSESEPERPDAGLTVDPDAFCAIRGGSMLAIQAFAAGRLVAEGDIDTVLGFEGYFRLAGGGPPRARIRTIGLPGADVSAITAGDGPEHVVCLHGLGASKLSFFTTIADLARTHTVHALDLPGFGDSGKPARAPYDAEFFARSVRRYLDATGIGSAHLIGNSMGGRVAIELALTHPERVRSLGLIAPAMAFLRGRELAPIVKLLRPELAAIPHPMLGAIVRRQLRGLFADPDQLSSEIEKIGADAFVRAYRSRAGRIAFYAAARNIYLESPHGNPGFWQRLAGLERPALFIWGADDRLVPAGFARHVERALPNARNVVIDGCGHVPQIESPERTNSLLAEHVGAHGTPVRDRRRDRLRARLGGVAASFAG